MEVMLLKNISSLGKVGDKINVKAGFGRNYLIPSGLALSATKDNIAEFEARRIKLEKQTVKKLAVAEARKKELDNTTIIITRKSGNEGKLFGSVGALDIAKALTKRSQLQEVKKSEVRLPNNGSALRVVGTYKVLIHLHPKIDAVITVNVIGEK